MIGTPCSARRLTAWPRTLRPISCRSLIRPASEAPQSLGPQDAADARYPVIPRNAAAQIAQGEAAADATELCQVSRGAVVIDKRLVLFWLGWGQERAGAWEELFSHWQELGFDRSALRGFQAWGAMVLTNDPKANLDTVENWAR